MEECDRNAAAARAIRRLIDAASKAVEDGLADSTLAECVSAIGYAECVLELLGVDAPPQEGSVR